MRFKSIVKKCMWIMLVILMSFLMFQAGQAASKNIWINGDPTFQSYIALSWEILKGIAAIIPVWLLSLLGLARSFFGENWFPFAEKIPVHITKVILVTGVILLIGITAAGAVYSEFTEDFHAQYRMEHIVEGWQNVFAWVLFYGSLLYAEQWCIQRNCSRQNIRKKQAWITVTFLLTCLIVASLRGMDLWYIPLDYVDSPNRLEDYLLWWYSLYMAVFFLPPWFFSARKTVRLFKNNTQWLTLSTIISKRITALIALMLTGLVVWQIQEYRSCISWLSFSEVPEHAEAMAVGHEFQAMIWGLALFYMLCLLAKQILAVRRAKREQQHIEETV